MAPAAQQAQGQREHNIERRRVTRRRSRSRCDTGAPRPACCSQGRTAGPRVRHAHPPSLLALPGELCSSPATGASGAARAPPRLCWRIRLRAPPGRCSDNRSSAAWTPLERPPGSRIGAARSPMGRLSGAACGRELEEHWPSHCAPPRAPQQSSGTIYATTHRTQPDATQRLCFGKPPSLGQRRHRLYGDAASLAARCPLQLAWRGIRRIGCRRRHADFHCFHVDRAKRACTHLYTNILRASARRVTTNRQLVDPRGPLQSLMRGPVMSRRGRKSAMRHLQQPSTHTSLNSHVRKRCGDDAIRSAPRCQDYMWRGRAYSRKLNSASGSHSSTDLGSLSSAPQA